MRRCWRTPTRDGTSRRPSASAGGYKITISTGWRSRCPMMTLRVVRASPRRSVRIATGETDYGSAGMKRHLEARAADVLMPDLQRMGGPTEFLRAAALCHAWQQPVSSHLFTETSAHLLAASPNALILEHMAWWEPLFTEPTPIEGGYAVLTEKPGIGVELSHAALKRFKA